MDRFSTGLRHDAALVIDPVTGRVWGATHGRDDLGAGWGWDDSAAANQSAGMLDQLVQNGYYGWPYSWGDWTPNGTTLVRAPE